MGGHLARAGAAMLAAIARAREPEGLLRGSGPLGVELRKLLGSTLEISEDYGSLTAG